MKDSKIQWTHHTFNPWIGCTGIDPACDNCYAESLAGRFGVRWGAGFPRKRTGASYWKDPIAWNKRCAREGIRERVFCASLADVFDNEVPIEWRLDLFALIEATPHLDWLLLTKRIGNVSKMVPVYWSEVTFPSNVWLGISVGTQKAADRDIEKLAQAPARIRFISFEPILERVMVSTALEGIHWAILGGESGPRARHMNISWLVSLAGDCFLQGVPIFVKQLGALPVWDDNHVAHTLIDKKGGDINEWPTALQVREFPVAT